MKKLAALLLVLLLPFTASAEAYRLSVTVEADETLLLSEAGTLLQLLPESALAEGELLVTLLARVLNGFGLTMTAQADASEAALFLSGEEALRMTVHRVEDGMLLTSPMLNGYALSVADKEEDLSWPEAAVVSGAFSGDAYAGGTQCTAWTYLLDEVDVSLIVRAVTDDADQPVGMSLTVLQADAQLATLSLGFGQDGFTLVTGLGLPAQNYWHRLTCTQTEEGETIYLNGTVEEWLADKTEGFSSVSALYAPAEVSKLRAAITLSGENAAWSGKMCREDGVETICTFEGAISPEGTLLNAALSLGSSPSRAALTLRLALDAAEPLAPLDASVLTCAQEDDAALFDTLVKQFTASAAARMIKLLPMDLILELTQYVSVP